MSLKDYIFFPDNDTENYSFYKRQEACDWSAEEFNFFKEKDDYLKASPGVQNLLKKIIGFFLIGDGLISDALVDYIKEALEEKNWPKIFYLSMQLKVENTHAETYSKAALTIVPDSEHDEIISMCEKKECLVKKGLWIQKNAFNENKALELLGCAIGEGIFFVAQFAIIFYMRKLNLFKNFIESNEQISKDETLHRDQKCMEAKKYFVKSDYESSLVEKALSMIKEAVEIEKIFARDLLDQPILGEQADRDAGLTIENLDGYIEMLADQICHLTGLPLVYKKEVTLNWMTDINLSQKTNFYERDVVGSYRKFNPNKEDETEEQTNEEVFDNLEDADF